MRMAIALLPLLLAACATDATRAPPPAAANNYPLRNAGFESPPRPGERCPAEWGCTMHADPDAFRFRLDDAAPAEGRRSLCIERVTAEPWAVASQSVPAQALRGRKVRFSIAMRGEGLAGPGAGPWLMVNGMSGGMLVHEERVAKIGPRWERRAIELVVPAQAEALEVGATLQGAGRVCIDDARLDPA
ncbi:MAG: hypothetical protein ACM3SO_11125 [Betaproteobacteria bacterium]